MTVEEIDTIFHHLATRTKWSSPAIRASRTQLPQKSRDDVESIYKRLSAQGAKWFTRLVLKNLKPLIFNENMIFNLCDPLLPSILKINGDFVVAMETLQSIRRKLLPQHSSEKASYVQTLAQIKPRIGVKVGRQHWLKGRSIKHCISKARGRMSVEEKIDGEYCQIHVDLSKGRNCLQIFSKSGKDSTEDKLPLHR